MATNDRFGSKPSKLSDPNRSPGVKFDAGPYIGIIKNNVDATRSGRLQVFIPDLGGQEDNPLHWRTVQYASPFFGMASRPNKNKSEDNAWDKVNHTYGMWFTPPDIDNQVLITFVTGNPSRGYWFACINPTVSHSMMPGISGSAAIDRTHLSEDLKEALTGEQYPTVEFNETDPSSWASGKRSNLDKIPKPIHEEQVRILLEQGLEDDLARGVTTSSSQRESPSTVFGISTPGTDSGNKADLDPDTKSPYYRLGGHQFIMDDGDIDGYDQMIRLRTAAGHQIMMNDSEDIFYIATANGKVWMEFTGEGKVHMYAEDTFSLRAKKEINLHSDTDINMHAGNNINMFATNSLTAQSKNIGLTGTTEIRAFGGLIGIKSSSAINVQAATQGSFKTGGELVLQAGGQIGINSGAALAMQSNGDASILASGSVLLTGSTIGINDAPAASAPTAPEVTKPTEITVSEFPDAVKVGLKWGDSGKVNSSVTVVPHHEPWLTEHNTVNPPAPAQTVNTAVTVDDVVTTVQTTPPPEVIPAPVDTTSEMPGPKLAVGKGLISPATTDAFNSQPTPESSIGNLSALQTKALLTQIGSGVYQDIAADDTLGKYYISAETLTAQGYTIAGTTNKDLGLRSNWTNKNGIEWDADFLFATSIQDSVILKKLADLHAALTTKGILNETTKPTTTGGILAVANTFGVDETVSWANSGSEKGSQLYNQGRYAVDVLAQTPPYKVFTLD